jgi:hypothetical protein
MEEKVASVSIVLLQDLTLPTIMKHNVGKKKGPFLTLPWNLI